MIKKNKIGLLASAFVAMTLAAPTGAFATNQINLTVTNPVSGQSSTQHFPLSAKISELRKNFSLALGSGVYKHNLTYNGRVLDDNAPLSLYNIPNDSTLGVGASSGGLNLEVYKINNVNQVPTDADITGRCTVGVPTTVGTVNFNFGVDKVFNCQADFDLVKMKGFIAFPTDRTVEFCTNSDDGNRLFISDNLIAGSWARQPAGGGCGQVEFQAGVAQKFEYDFYEWGGGANWWLNYSYTENGSDWTDPATVPTTAFNTNDGWIDESARYVTGFSGRKGKLTTAGKATLDDWYANGGSDLSSISISANNEDNSPVRSQQYLSSVRAELKRLGFTGSLNLVARDGNRGNASGGNVSQVELPVIDPNGPANFWSTVGDVAAYHNKVQFGWERGQSATHVIPLHKFITSATVTSLIDNSIDNSVNSGSVADDYSLTISLRDAADNELAANTFGSNVIHGPQNESATVNYSGLVDHVVVTAVGFDAGYWLGYYGPTFVGAKLTTTN